jgi:hypothetical protein
MVVSPPRRTRVRPALAAALVALLACLASRTPALAQPAAAEYELKAAFLYNFAKFVEWPEGGAAAEPLCIGVVGEDPFGPTLDRLLAGKTIHDRPITIRRFASVEAVTSCQLLFVSAATAPTIPRETYCRPGVLAVGESDDFLAAGGVIAFTMEGNKLRFSVNVAAGERAQLKLSSQLLKLARRVVREGE